MTNFCKGDVVTARGTIAYVYDKEEFPSGRTVAVMFDDAYETVLLKPGSLKFEHSKFEVGERVWCADVERYGHVRAVDGDCAWVAYEGAAVLYGTLSLRDLERAPLQIAEAAE